MNGDASEVQIADVAVVGGGPAGIAAATRAAERGKRVILLDQGTCPGGQIWRHTSSADAPRGAAKWLHRLRASGVTVIERASVMDLAVSRGGAMIVAERDALPLRVQAARVVLATGARERFLPFPGWTLPGVMGVGGAQALLKTGTPFAGKRVVVAGSGPLLLAVAASLTHAGAKVLLVAEQASQRDLTLLTARLWRRPDLIARAAQLRLAFSHSRYAPATWVTSVSGNKHVQSVTLAGASPRIIDCDVVCVGYGLVGNTELARLAGCTTDLGFVAVDQHQATSVAGVYCAGEPTGIGGLELSLLEGEIAGIAAADEHSVPDALVIKRDRARAVAASMERAFALRPELRDLPAGDTIICRCEDVHYGALDPAWSPRQAKLYTRCGMGPCQGRICGTSLEFLRGWTHDVVRPPVQPALISTLLADGTPPSPPLDNGAIEHGAA